MNIRQITDIERHLTAQVEALTSEVAALKAQLELERNTLMATSQVLEQAREQMAGGVQ